MLHLSFVFSFLILFSFGCASTPETSSLLKNSDGLPSSHLILDVPYFEQPENACGPATLQMIATYHGWKGNFPELSSKMFTPVKKGTLETDYVGAARRLGFFAIPLSNLRDLLTEVSANHPIAVFQNLGSTANPIWHYSVLFGFDLDREELTFHSGKDKNLKMDMRNFERAWQKAGYWALLILQPEEPPLAGSLSDSLNAASALERVKQLSSAEEVYQHILKKWPESSAAYFGLGNVFFSKKQYRQAEAMYTRASLLDPESPLIQNNLKETKKFLRR